MKKMAELRDLAGARAPSLAIGDNSEETFNDIGNKDRFVRACADTLAFVPEKKLWRAWDSTRWRDDNGAAMRSAELVACSLFEAVGKEKDADKRKRLFQHANRTSMLGKLRAMVDLAQASDLCIPQNRWDADPMLLGVKNGIVDLRTGELLPPNPKALIGRYANVEFDAEAKCPQWTAFLRRIMAEDRVMMSFLRRAAGYSLIGHNTERVFFIGYGVGANGKSKFLQALEHVAGEYACASPASTFLSRRTGIPNDLARLAGARMVTCIETDKDRKLSEALVKSVTGEDKVSARFLYGEFFDFTPIAKIWIATNHKPNVQGTEPAIWERILLIPFEVVIPRAERDLKLGEKLRAEAAGILNWMLSGCLQWQEKGLRPPDTVRAATEQYRRDMDVVARWLEEVCEPAPESFVTATGAYKRYCEWCVTNHEPVLSQRVFGEEMHRQGIPKTRSAKGNRYMGINFRSSESEG